MEKAAEKAKPTKAEEAKGKAAKPEEAVEEVGAAPLPCVALGIAWGNQIIQVFKSLVTATSQVFVSNLSLVNLLWLKLAVGPSPRCAFLPQLQSLLKTASVLVYSCLSMTAPQQYLNMPFADIACVHLVPQRSAGSVLSVACLSLVNAAVITLFL